MKRTRLLTSILLVFTTTAIVGCSDFKKFENKVTFETFDSSIKEELTKFNEIISKHVDNYVNRSFEYSIAGNSSQKVEFKSNGPTTSESVINELSEKRFL